MIKRGQKYFFLDESVKWMERVRKDSDLTEKWIRKEHVIADMGKKNHILNIKYPKFLKFIKL